MMKNYKFLFGFLAFLLLNPIFIFAQRSCSSMDVLMENIQKDPAVVQRMMDIEQHTQNFIRSNGAQTRAVVTIPVVVHVIYRTATENISDAQIQSQITVLNQDFRRTNADRTTQWSQAADAEIQFCLANVDPNGAATTGITRTSTTVTSFSTNDAMKYTAQGGKDAWATNRYLNIWVCNIGGGILGYAQFPGGGSAATDGVVIGYNYFGTTGTATAPFNKGRTATHEVGHWLNLRHIWGDGPCGTDDFVTDTPESDAANYGCATGHISCGTVDMVENYMDYSDDACMNLFTLGQKTRMQALFATGGSRASLLTSTGCSGGGSTTPVYCNTNATNTAYEWISNVTFNTINNTSTASTGGYGNFTTLTTNVTKGTAYTIRLTPGFASTAYSEYFTVYIDYNNDQDFLDAGETVYTSAATTAAVSASITIPSTASTAATRMRVIMSDAAITGPCNVVNYGEVEDYSINIQAATTTTCTAPTGLSVTNITSSGAKFNWTAVTGATSYTIQVKPSASTTWTTFSSVTGTSFSVTGMTASTTYNWQILSVCSGGSSAYATGPNFTTTAATACSDGYESNNTLSTAKTITANTNITASISSSTDIDWFKFSNTSTAKNIRVTLTNLPADYDLGLYNSAGTLLYSSANGGTTSETVTYNNAPVATYYIRVIGYNGAFNTASCYTLRASTSSTTFVRLAGEEASEAEVTTPKEEIAVFEELADIFSINLYPNPATDVLNIAVQTVDNNINGQIFDATGRIIWTGLLDKGANNINLNELPAGMYHFVALQSNGERISKTFTKMK